MDQKDLLGELDGRRQRKVGRWGGGLAESSGLIPWDPSSKHPQ